MSAGKFRVEDKAGKKEGFLSMLENHPVPMWVCDRESLSFLEINRAALRQLGYRKADLKTITLENLFAVDKFPLLRADLKRARRSITYLGEWYLLHKTGRWLAVELACSAASYKERKVILMTAHPRSDQTLERRILESRLRLSQLAHYHSLDDLLQKTLDEIEELTGSCIGFFHFVEADQQMLGLQTWSTNTLKNMCTAEGKHAHYGIDQAGVWVECVFKRKPVIYNDYASLAHRKGLPDGHAPVLRVLTVPIVRKNSIVAILGLGNKATDYEKTDVMIVTLLADLAWDIACAKSSEEDLRVAEEKYHAIFEKATVGIFQSTPQGRFLSVNPAMARMYGYDSPSDMIESIRSISTQVYEHSEKRMNFQRALDEGDEVYEYIGENLRKDGSHIITSTNARAVRDANGEVLYYEGFVQDVTARKRSEEDLLAAQESLRLANFGLRQALEREQLFSRTDSLTAVYNRRHFFELAEQAFDVTKRYESLLSMIMFDIDGFKQFNDAYGHLAGDEILKQVAQIALGQLRRADIFARYGGEEFIVLLPNSSTEQTLVVAERIRESIAHYTMPAGGRSVGVTVSIGVAGYAPEIETLDGFIKRADQAMYAAKRAGKNCVRIFSGE